MVSRNYDSEGCNERVPLYFAVPGYDKVIELGSIKVPSYAAEIAREVLNGLRQAQTRTSTELSEDLDLILAQADELERKSESLLSKIKYGLAS